MPAFLALAVIPFGPEVSIFGVITPLQLTDFPVAVLYILAVASIGIYGIVFAGWSSGSTYPLLGSLRSSAQMISYEIAMGLAFVAVFLYAGSMSTSQIVAAQQPIWYALILLPSFIIYVTAMVGETNRAPFDLPEAESELVAGFHTEYSSLKFALFFLAEYINMVTVSALATTLFLGGWQAPWPISAINDGMLNRGWWGLLWFLVKVCDVPVPVHLAARHAPAVPLRPVHEVRLEGPDPRLAGLDRAGRRRFRALRDELPSNAMTVSVIVIATLLVVFVGSYLIENRREKGRAADRGRGRGRGRGAAPASRADTPSRRCRARRSSSRRGRARPCPARWPPTTWPAPATIRRTGGPQCLSSPSPSGASGPPS